MKNCFFFLLLVLVQCTATDQKISDDVRYWLEQEAARQIVGCAVVAHDGTVLYTPDGEGHYAALWTRDFAYMVENAGEFIVPIENIKKAILYLLQGQRADGCIPDRVQADGLAVYSAGPVNNPLGDPPTDNSQFMVKLVSDYVRHTNDRNFFTGVAQQLVDAMNFTPRSENGLVFIDPQYPHSPYGFTDTIQKTGELLFSSLLYWEACKDLERLFAETGDSRAAAYKARAELIEKNSDALWDDSVGMFLAAAVDCRQVDIWGNAYAIYCGFPLGEKKERIVAFLAGNFNRYVYKGQIRHIAEPDFWQKTLAPIKGGEYQNGAYWGTASGWVAYALMDRHPRLADKIVTELLADYRQHGVYECINKGYAKLDRYVASAVNPLGAVKRMQK